MGLTKINGKEEIIYWTLKLKSYLQIIILNSFFFSVIFIINVDQKVVLKKIRHIFCKYYGLMYNVYSVKILNSNHSSILNYDEILSFIAVF